MDAPHEQTASLEESVDVEIYYRKPGVKRADNPYGYKKMVIRQHPDALAFWRQAVQYRVPNQPNLTIVFDGRVLNPRVVDGAEEELEEELAPILVDDELTSLEGRKLRIRQDIIVAEARREALEEGHMERRKSLQDEEERLQKNLERSRETLAKLRAEFESESAAIHARIKQQLAFEAEVTGQSQARILALEVEKTEHMAERRDEIARVGELARELEDGKKGTPLERLIDNGAEKVARVWNGGLGALTIGVATEKIGLSEKQIDKIFSVLRTPPRPGG